MVYASRIIVSSDSRMVTVQHARKNFTSVIINWSALPISALSGMKAMDNVMNVQIILNSRMVYVSVCCV